MDVCHAALLTTLVACKKPSTLLEVGVGGGRSVNAVLRGLRYNKKPYTYTVVDNWYDWGGVQPPEVAQRYGDSVKVVTSNEKDYVFSCTESYDFIVSDGDHHNTDKWFEYVYDKLLNPGGTLVYHDVNLVEEQFVNLRNIYEVSKKRNLRFELFNSNSLPEELCQRGLLVIFK